MPSAENHGPGQCATPRDYFATTHWTSVLHACRSDSTSAREALAKLCQTYWYPLYAYVRRRGEPPQDAEDLTQGFFERLIELNSLQTCAVRRESFAPFSLRP